jgi:hypothetical protein
MPWLLLLSSVSWVAFFQQLPQVVNTFVFLRNFPQTLQTGLVDPRHSQHCRLDAISRQATKTDSQES